MTIIWSTLEEWKTKLTLKQLNLRALDWESSALTTCSLVYMIMGIVMKKHLLVFCKYKHDSRDFTQP